MTFAVFSISYFGVDLDVLSKFLIVDHQDFFGGRISGTVEDINALTFQ